MQNGLMHCDGQVFKRNAMRKVTGILTEKLGKRLVNYLNAQGIDAEFRSQDDGGEAWIHDEDRLRRARAIVEEFTENPDLDKFTNAIFTPKPPKPEVKHIDVRRDIFSRNQASSAGKLTIFLIVVCSALHLATSQTPTGAIRMALFYSQYRNIGIPEIMSGQVWRLVTPILLHGDFFHLLFNMIWLYQLGNQIEQIKGTRYFSFLIVVLAVLCNTAQFLTSGPAFLGMSGVVYGMLGFIWMHTRYQTGTSFELSQQTVVFMVIWMFLCLFNVIQSVANAEHVMGFVAGTAWGYFSSGGFKMWWRRRWARRHFR
jgi:GlpG protein